MREVNPSARTAWDYTRIHADKPAVTLNMPFIPRPKRQGRHHLTLALTLASLLFCSAADTATGMRIYVLPAGEPPSMAVPLPRGALPDTRIGHGRNDISRAWLISPSRRLSGGRLGDNLEATAVSVTGRDQLEYRYELPEDSAFEDLLPRVHDINGDGLDEIILVRSRRETGSSLLILGIREGRLQPIAESPPLLAREQWINPIGIADVDGDGKPELLAVHSPHGNGVLMEYRLEGNRLIPMHSIDGVSNHVFGSRNQGMAALMDANGDGIADVLIPSSDRRQLRAISFNSGVPLEFARITLPGPAMGDFEVAAPDILIVPLEDGRKVRIDWR